jgi:hypothetical protein
MKGMDGIKPQLMSDFGVIFGVIPCIPFIPVNSGLMFLSVKIRVDPWLIKFQQHPQFISNKDEGDGWDET